MNWKLTRDAIGRPVIDVFNDEDLTWGMNLLRELARNDDSLTEVEEGRFIAEKERPGWER